MEKPAETVSDQACSVTDREIIEKAAAIIESAIDRDWDRRPPAAMLLKALCRLPQESTEEGNVPGGWNSDQLGQVMPSLRGDGWDEWHAEATAATNNVQSKLHPETSRKVSKIWKELEALWPRRAEGLRSRLIDAEIAVNPKLRMSPGKGRGNHQRYSLNFLLDTPQTGPGRDIPPPRIRQVPRGADPLEIRYIAADISVPVALRWLLPPGGRSVQSRLWRVAAVLLTLAGVAIVWLALAMLYLSLIQNTVLGIVHGIFATAVVAIFLVFSLGWWWRLLENNVSRAPFWLQSSFSYGFNVIERRLAPTADQWSTVHLVRYVADCPLCGADGHGRSAVRLESGRLAFFGRIVGRCRYAPNEHVWSFDHVTHRGRFLR